MPQVKPEIETFAKIKVIGVGGSGGSAVDRMVQSGIRGVDFWVMNTDVQALHHNSAPHKLHIGKTVTRGLGAGMDPDMGKRSAEEAQNEIREALKDTDMVFVTCGLGGGTGSGASPVIAEIAREMGALTVGVVTRPFGFEGPQRRKIADGAFNELAKHVDTIITIPNDRVLQIIDKKTSLLDAFKMVDDVLHQGVQGISELITIPGEINVDFADVKSIMSGTGSALMGIGTASGENRAAAAAKAAISSPLLELSIDGARGILFTITGSADLGMLEVQEAANIITSSADENAKTIFGTVIDETMGDEIRITVIATGFDDPDVSMAPLSLNTKSIDEYRSEPLSAPKRAIFNAPKFSWQERNNTTQQDIEDEMEEEIEDEYRAPEFRKSAEPSSIPKAAAPLFTSRQMPESPTETFVPTVPKKVQKPIPTTSSSDDVDQNDLEIPAFIRRKMGL